MIPHIRFMLLSTSWENEFLINGLWRDIWPSNTFNVSFGLLVNYKLSQMRRTSSMIISSHGYAT